MSNSQNSGFSAFNMIANIVRLGYQPTNLDDVQQLLERWTGERWRRATPNSTDVPDVNTQHDESNGQNSAEPVMTSHPADGAPDLTANLNANSNPTSNANPNRNACSNVQDPQKEDAVISSKSNLASHRSRSDVGNVQSNSSTLQDGTSDEDSNRVNHKRVRHLVTQRHLKLKCLIVQHKRVRHLVNWMHLKLKCLIVQHKVRHYMISLNNTDFARVTLVLSSTVIQIFHHRGVQSLMPQRETLRAQKDVGKHFIHVLAYIFVQRMGATWW